MFRSQKIRRIDFQEIEYSFSGEEDGNYDLLDRSLCWKAEKYGGASLKVDTVTGISPVTIYTAYKALFMYTLIILFKFTYLNLFNLWKSFPSGVNTCGPTWDRYTIPDYARIQ